MNVIYNNNNNKTEIIIKNKSALSIKNLEIIGELEYFDRKYLFLKNNFGIIDKYKLINNIFEKYEKTKNDYKVNSIVLNNNNNLENIIFKCKKCYENIKNKQKGLYDLYDNYLILYGHNYIYFYEYGNIYNFYNYMTEQNNFDWIYYKKITKDLNDDNCKNFETAYKHWLSNKNNKYIDNSVININGIIKNIVIDHTNLKIYENNTLLFSEIEIEMNIINIKETENKKITYYAILNNNYYEKINIVSEKDYKNNTVYIISNIGGGGSLKYINDITYKYKNAIILKNKNDLLNAKYNKNDILLVQHLLFTDILITDIINIKNKYYVDIIISIHDYYWINNNLLRELKNTNTAEWHSNYLKNNIDIFNNIKLLFQNATQIIHPSIFTYKHYSRYYDNSKFNLVYHNDIKICWKNKIIRKINNNTINIGILHEMSVYKGLEFINYLKKNVTKYENYNINYLIVNENIPKYKEEEFEEYLDKFNIHGTLLLNKWGETYCYLLTKIINSGIPFVYNNLGAFSDRICFKKEHHFKVFDNENECNNYSKINKIFTDMIKYIIFNNNSIEYNSYYNNLFENKQNIENIENKQNNENIKNNEFIKLDNYDFKKIHSKIKPFAIYFPQFHEIEENNKNYYKGFSDIQNLNKYINNGNMDNLETPNMKLYNLKDITEYDITNEKIQEKQIEIAKKYGIYGFAIYYYWFSINTITNKNTIMEDGYKYFFKNDIEDFKFYFIWANENWTGNPAFNTSEKITNNYDIRSYFKNINNLMKYFKHNNYLKIDNKPVLFIHHPIYIIELNKMINFFNVQCIKNGFNGILIYSNNTDYKCHPEYKNLKKNSIAIDNNKIRYINYDIYCENIINEGIIQCLFFDFNNSARLFIPDKLKLRTYVLNNTPDNQKKHIENILSRYNNYANKSNVNNILLINAWNEWGEKMNIEPSNEKNDFYLSIIRENLIKYFE